MALSVLHAFIAPEVLRGLGAWGWLEMLNIFPSLKSALRVEMLEGRAVGRVDLVAFGGVVVFTQPTQAPEQSQHAGFLFPVLASCGVGRLFLLLESMVGVFMDLVV